MQEASVVSPKHDTAEQRVRRMTAWIGGESRLPAAVLRTVGNKGNDGFLLAYGRQIALLSANGPVDWHRREPWSLA
jgi:hypothetical protein